MENTLTYPEKFVKALNAYDNAASKNLHEAPFVRIFRGSKITGRFIYCSHWDKKEAAYHKMVKDFGEKKTHDLIDIVLDITQHD